MILSDYIQVISGGTPKTDNQEFWNGNIPWISIKDFTNITRYIYSTEKYITALGLEHSATNILNKDDIIISARGTVGQIALLSKDMAFNQSCYGIRSITKCLYQKYLYYWLLANKNSILSSTHGAVFDTITKDDFSRINIDLPSLPTQQHIVDTIGSVDDAIEKNEEIIEKIKNYGNTLFTTINKTDYVNLTDIVSFDKGIEIGAKNYIDKQVADAIPYIRVSNLLTNNHDTFCFDDNYKKCDYNDILIAFDGAPGRNSIGLEGVYSSGIYKVICDKKLLGYIYFYINSSLCQDVIKQNSQGTTILHASKSIKLLTIPYPINNELNENFNNLYNQLVVLFKKQIKLKEIKQVLLNKYFD